MIHCNTAIQNSQTQVESFILFDFRWLPSVEDENRNSEESKAKNIETSNKLIYNFFVAMNCTPPQ